MCAALGIAEEQEQSPTIAAARALSDLVETARVFRNLAKDKRRRDIAKRCQVIAVQLDATRTRLVQDGDEYLDTAWAYVDAGRRSLGTYSLVLR
jgi:hypothetical protein